MPLFQTSVLKKYLSQQDHTAVQKAYRKYSKYFLNAEIQENIRSSKEEQFQATFLTELFVNVLDYTINPSPKYNLTTEYKNEKNNRKADEAILKDSTTLAVVELKGTNTKDLESICRQAFDYKVNHKVFVQCFEVAPLQYINSKYSVKLVQLISTWDVKSDGSLDFEVPEGEFISNVAPFDFYADGDVRTYKYFTMDEGMRFTATYADGIGPWKPFIIPFKTDVNGAITVLPKTDFIELAHENDLQVHPYTFRNEDEKWSGAIPKPSTTFFLTQA